MKDDKEEIWKDIAGYEGHYQVSDKGRIKSVKFRKERILKPRRDTRGYLRVNLCKNGEIKQYMVHRLVAKVFISNLDNLPMINHKDENPSNNRVENLEWCSAKYNNNYGTHIQRISEKLSKPVLQFTKSGEFVKKWKSATDVELNLGYSQSNISKCCLEKYNSANGFIWKYKN